MASELDLRLCKLLEPEPHCAGMATEGFYLDSQRGLWRHTLARPLSREGWRPAPVSTDPAAAMRVVKTIARMGGLYWELGGHDGRHNAMIVLGAEQWPALQDIYDAHATTLEEAICRAAVAFLEARDKRG